jgi:hypothetical protein
VIWQARTELAPVAQEFALYSDHTPVICEYRLADQTRLAVAADNLSRQTESGSIVEAQEIATYRAKCSSTKAS